MSKVSNFLNNLDKYQEVGAKALGVEHRFAIGGISMMQAVLGVVTLGIGILIGVVVYKFYQVVSNYIDSVRSMLILIYKSAILSAPLYLRPTRGQPSRRCLTRQLRSSVQL
tara:strand:+ start:606 stop:938 length:333 start_codon:yes stop_codon:yes gene_type:complete